MLIVDDIAGNGRLRESLLAPDVVMCFEWRESTRAQEMAELRSSR